MKKLISCLMLVAMLASLLTVGASAAKSASPDANKVLNIAYGSAEIDGKLDEAYKKSDKVTAWIHNTYNQLVDKKDEVTTDFYSYVLYDDEKIYVYAEVKDTTPVVPANVKNKNHTTDCIEFYWYLGDLEAAGDVQVYSDLLHMGSGVFRVHTKEVCPEDDLLPNHFTAKNGMNMGIVNEDLKTKVFRQTTSTGYIVEFSMEIDDSVKANVAAGKTIGYGIQVNDDYDDNNTRDALLWSSNNIGDNPKVGPFMLLAKDAAPATTAAPETTKAPETTAAPVTTKAPAATTKAPAVTPATADVSPVMMMAVIAAAAAIVLVRRRVR